VVMTQVVMCPQVVAAQPLSCGQNQNISPAMTSASNSLSTGATKLFFLIFLLVVFLAVFFFLGIALLYLYSRGENQWAASGLLIEELAQGIFHFGVDEAPFKWTSAAAV
jgi:hypothetical protein